jgi:hypothetical protein
LCGREIQDSLLPKTLRRLFAGLRYKLRRTLFRCEKKAVSQKPLKQYGNAENADFSIKNHLERIFPNSSYTTAGFTSSLIDLLPYEMNQDIKTTLDFRAGMVWFGETIMRGPIFFRTKDYLKLGGFNTQAFYQGLDDHDLNVRVRNRGKKVGFTPILFSAPIKIGSMRGKKTFTSNLWSNLHAFLRRSGKQKSELYQLLCQPR